MTTAAIVQLLLLQATITTNSTVSVEITYLGTCFNLEPVFGHGRPGASGTSAAVKGTPMSVLSFDMNTQFP